MNVTCVRSCQVVRVMMFQSSGMWMGDDRLNIEDDLRALVRTVVEVGVVLKRKAVEVTDWILQLLGEGRGTVGAAIVDPTR
jgi:hypothetical protein